MQSQKLGTRSDTLVLPVVNFCMLAVKILTYLGGYLWVFCLVGFLGFFDSANSVLSVPDSAHIQPEVVQS